MEKADGSDYGAIGYNCAIAQLEQMRGAYLRVLQKLSAEDRSVIEKHTRLLETACDEFGKYSYINGYQHGLRHRDK